MLFRSVRLGSIVTILTKNRNAWEKFVSDFPYYYAICERVGITLEKYLMDDAPLMNFHPTSSAFQRQREAELARLRAERDGLSAMAHPDKLTTAGHFEDMAATIDRMRTTTRFEADKHQIQVLANIARQISEYWKEGDFSERDFHYRRAREAIRAFNQDLDTNPTRLGIESIKSVIVAMLKAMDSNFDEYKDQARTILELSNVIPNDYYMPDDNGCIQVRIDVASKAGGAPVEALELIAWESDGLELVETGVSPELLRGGEKREIELQVRPSSRQFAEKAFTLELELNYTRWNGEAAKLSDIKLPIRLGKPGEFFPIENPYERFATGASITARDVEMFKGRRDILDRIIKVIEDGDLGQCFALHG